MTSTLVQSWAYITVIGGILMNAAIAFYVFKDAQVLNAQQPSKLKVLTPAAWGIVSFFGSLVGFGVYLAAHYSTIAKDRS